MTSASPSPCSTPHYCWGEQGTLVIWLPWASTVLGWIQKISVIQRHASSSAQAQLAGRSGLCQSLHRPKSVKQPLWPPYDVPFACSLDACGNDMFRPYFECYIVLPALSCASFRFSSMLHPPPGWEFGTSWLVGTAGRLHRRPRIYCCCYASSGRLSWRAHLL